MKRFFLAFLILVLTAGCATLGTEITKDNNYIRMPHYSFTIPVSNGWHIQKPGGKAEVAVIVKKEKGVFFQIQIIRNRIPFYAIFSVKDTTAEDAADDYRSHEEQGMLMMGVKKGLYQLKDVIKSEEKIGDKTFYTMNYLILKNEGRQNAGLYLYYPKEKNNETFIVAHYSESIAAGASLAKSYKHDFKKILESLKILEMF